MAAAVGGEYYVPLQNTGWVRSFNNELVSFTFHFLLCFWQWLDNFPSKKLLHGHVALVPRTTADWNDRVAPLVAVFVERT